jgi:putative ABC transport system permease protein
MLDVLLLLSKKYFGIAILSCLVGSLITFYVMDEWLQNFAFAIRLGIPDFLIPLSAITIIVVLTVSYNCLKTSLINPSQSLKHH